MQIFVPGALALTLALTLSAPATAQSERLKYKESDFVSSEKIAQSGGLKIDIPDLGTVVLRRVESPWKGECLVHLPSVRQELIQRNYTTTGIKAEIWLDFIVEERPEGNQPLCIGGGNQCRMEVELPES